MSEIFIGLMSGTSIDGVDAVIAQFEPFRLLATHGTPIDDATRAQILALCEPGQNEIARMGTLDFSLGELFAQASRAVLSQTALSNSDITAIGSHGQTVRHYPEQGFSLQIGNPTLIAEQTGITTIADFRRRDLAAGGQGAPLVPAFHEWFFHHEARDRVIVNIGGMANITLLPADKGLKVSGFDTGPGNVLMDSWIYTHQQQRYDACGQWAAQGQIDTELLNTMLGDPYFDLPAPKSTGREHFNVSWLAQQIKGRDISPVDIQRTLVQLTAQTICDEIIKAGMQNADIYICGGGAHNSLLMQAMSEYIGHEVLSTETLGLHPDWVEAVAFAWLAYQTWHQQPSNLPDVTGAQGRRILGAIHYA